MTEDLLIRVPPFMIRSNVVTGVMSFDEMDAMMYKIEGEDLYLIGTSEHSMIGKFIDHNSGRRTSIRHLQAIRHVSEKKKVLMVLKKEVYTEFISLKSRK